MVRAVVLVVLTAWVCPWGCRPCGFGFSVPTPPEYRGEAESAALKLITRPLMDFPILFCYCPPGWSY